MASIFKRRDKWRAQVSKNGKRYSREFDTKRDAQHWASDLERELAAPEISDGARTLRELFSKYRAEVSPRKRGSRWELIRLRTFQQDKIADIQCSKLTPADLADWRDRRGRQVSAATVNRDMNILSAVFEQARREWGWMTVNPLRDVRRPQNPRPRDRRISEEEIEKVLDALGYPEKGEIKTTAQQTALAFLLALETAMRQGEIASLHWADVHLDQRYLIIQQSKNGESRQVPLSLRAVELLKRVPLRETVFTTSAGVMSCRFTQAVKAAGIQDLRFHDSRHEAITRLARKLDLLDLARMVGHRDLQSLRIYYNATATEIAGRLD